MNWLKSHQQLIAKILLITVLCAVGIFTLFTEQALAQTLADDDGWFNYFLELVGLENFTGKMTTWAGNTILKNMGWLFFQAMNLGGGLVYLAAKTFESALTMFGLNDMTARYASYEDFAEIIRHRFTEPKKTLKELYSRLVFNILCGNTDDHARNHAAFWDGKALTLTPAYDICPQGRTGNEASQAMKISGNRNLSQLKSCLGAAHHFLLSKKERFSRNRDNRKGTIP